MPTVWFAIKRSLVCKSQPFNVHDPTACCNGHTRRTGVCCGCSSRSTLNQKNPIPKSIASNEILSSQTHEVILNDSTCELKITGFGASQDQGDRASVASSFVGTLRSGTPCPTTRVSRDHFVRRLSFGKDSSNGPLGLRCHKCGEKFKKLEAAEAHHFSRHAVTELVEEDSSRKVVEIICQPNLSNFDNGNVEIDRILKVHNTQKTLAQFENFRETVKTKAGKLPKKHARCVADGNELLRFHGATIQCSLGLNGSSGLCTSNDCAVCRILRHGFSKKKEDNGVVGVFTTSTSARAFESIAELHVQSQCMRKALIVCRVIAGRVHKPTRNFQELAGQHGFDSLAGKMDLYSNVEELYMLNPRALLPCFLVVCKP